MSNQHVMIDIETLGNNSHAVILSIGATKFDPYGDTIDDTFYVAVDPESCVSVGLKLDISTIWWWMQDERNEARSAMVKENGRLHIGDALFGFIEWFGDDKPVWGNGATFDNVILRNALTACSLTPPWEFWNDRCYRTLKNLAPTVSLVREGIYHNALNDAISQTKHLQKIYQHIFSLSI